LTQESADEKKELKKNKKALKGADKEGLLKTFLREVRERLPGGGKASGQAWRGCAYRWRK
jgi:hypothetical protein